MRRRWLVRLMVALVLLGLLAAGLTWYLNAVVLPGPARQWLATWLAEQTGRRVQVGTLTFRPWEGVTVDRLILFEDPQAGPQPFLEIERVTCAVLYLPLLRERRLIIPSLRLMRPRIHLVRDPQQVWNAARLRLWRRPPAPATGPRLSILLLRVLIADGELLVEDQAHEPGLDATLTHLNLSAAWHSPHTVTVSGAARWQTVPATPVGLQGQWDPAGQAGQATLSARHVPLDMVRAYLPDAITAALQDLGGQADVTLHLEGTPAQAALTAAVETQGAHGRWRDVQGTGALTATGTFTLDGATPGGWRLTRAAALLNDIMLRPPAPWPTITQLRGTLEMTADGMDLSDITARVSDVPVQARGTLRLRRADASPPPAGLRLRRADASPPPAGLRPAGADPGWRRPMITAEVLSDAPLQALWQAAAPYRTGWLAALGVEGAGQLRITAEGAWPQPQWSAALDLTDARVTLPALEPIEHLAGRLQIKPDLLTVTHLQGTWRGRPLHGEGTLVNFSAPELDLAGGWGALRAEGAVALSGSHLTLSRLTTTYRQSQAQTTGEVELSGPAWDGTLYSDFSIAVSDALPHWPRRPAPLDAWQPSGIIRGHGFLRGPLRQIRRAEGGLKWRAADLTTARGLRLDNLQGEYRQRDGIGSLTSLTTLVAGGAVALSGTSRLEASPQPFDAQVTVQDLELGRLAREIGWTAQQVSGRVTAEGRFQGTLDDGWGSLAGEGRVQVTNGRLFEMPLFGGLADLLAAPALRRVTFREAAGTFAVARRVLTSRDLTFYSDLATLTADGSIGPGEALAARVVASLDPTAFEHSPGFARSAGRFLHKAGYLIGEIRVSGTLSHPTYELVPVSLNRVLKEQVLGRLGSVLGELVQ